MKRILIVALALSGLSMLLTGCGGGKESGTTGGGTTAPTVVRGGNYTLTDLGTLGLTVEPVGFTADGAIAGNFLKQTEDFFYFGNFIARVKPDLSGGTIQDITPVGYETREKYLEIKGVNTRGQAAGVISGRSLGFYQGAAWDLALGTGATVNALTRPPDIFETGPQSLASAEDIGEEGQLVGIVKFDTEPDETRASLFLTQNGVYERPDLGELGADFVSGGLNAIFARRTTPHQILSIGVVIGTAEYFVSGGGNGSLSPRLSYARAFTYKNRRFTDLGVPDGFTDSRAFAANEQGQVIGEVQAVDPQDYYSQYREGKGFVYKDGRFTLLGTVGAAAGTRPLAISNSGTIVGATYTGDGSSSGPGIEFQRAFLWRDGTLVDLNTQIAPNSGWTLIKAVDIDNTGRIAAIGTVRGEPHVVLLIPRE